MEAYIRCVKIYQSIFAFRRHESACMEDIMKNVLEYLEQSARKYPNKIAVKDTACAYTYEQLQKKARYIGSRLAKHTTPKHPVCVFADKSADTLAVFFGIVYAGCFYTLVDPSFPEARIQSMLSVLQPDVIVDGSSVPEKLAACGCTERVIRMETLVHGLKVECTNSEDTDNVVQTGRDGTTGPMNQQKELHAVDEIDSDETGYADRQMKLSDIENARLQEIRESMIDTDPLYCNFTSGSTGTPKGVLVAHRSVIEFIDQFTEIFDITKADVIGNQAPFDFDVSVKDIYSAMKVGATLVVIPKAYFMFPNSVVDMLDENHVTTLIWAVSALCLLNRLHGLKHKVPADINKILFSGEAMPIRQLHAWQSCYPDAVFVNLYGPTEITCNCTYHILEREYTEEEKLPIGIPFPNERVFLLDEDDQLIEPGSVGKIGELCVAGTTLALGYYRNAAATAKAFTANPLNPDYPETIYRTGDLASYGGNGLLYFAGRKDFQIKHMGHRIELEEIEHALAAIPEIEGAACFYDREKNKVVACYIGIDDKKYLITAMKKKVPDYMVPNVFCKVDMLPLNKNGKTDKKLLEAQYKEGAFA
mgnify:FL=1